jgi:hypothetical protein
MRLAANLEQKENVSLIFYRFVTLHCMNGCRSIVIEMGFTRHWCRSKYMLGTDSVKRYTIREEYITFG